MHAELLLHDWIANVFPWMHLTRREALFSVVSSAAQGGRLTVTALGRSINSIAKEKHNIKRADRLLSNANLQAERTDIYASVSHQIICRTQRPVVLVDWSDIDKGQNFFLLRASTPVNGRSLTLYEEIHGLSTKEKPKTHCKFLKRLKGVLPQGCRPIIVTDAGFRGPWFQDVQRLGWDWVGRIRNRDKIKLHEEQSWKDVKSLHLQANRKPKLWSEALLTKKNALSCRLILYKAKSKGRVKKTKFGKRALSNQSRRNAAREREPWLLATSLPADFLLAKRVVKIYASRMQIEEAFRDLKSARLGLSLEYTGTYRINRLAILVLIGSLAAMFSWLLGTATRIAGIHRQFQANTVRNTNVLSVVFVGLQVFRKSKTMIKTKIFQLAKRQLNHIVNEYAYV